MEVHIGKRAVRQIRQSAAEVIEEGDMEALREDIYEAFSEEQIEEIERLGQPAGRQGRAGRGRDADGGGAREAGQVVRPTIQGTVRPGAGFRRGSKAAG